MKTFLENNSYLQNLSIRIREKRRHELRLAIRVWEKQYDEVVRHKRKRMWRTAKASHPPFAK